MNSYQIHIAFNKKRFTIKIDINKLDESDEKRYHYNLEIMTRERLSGDEFQKLRKYLEDEGYIDAAIEYYKSGSVQGWPVSKTVRTFLNENSSYHDFVFAVSYSKVDWLY